jgi:hypothetical protein
MIKKHGKEKVHLISQTFLIINLSFGSPPLHHVSLHLFRIMYEGQGGLKMSALLQENEAMIPKEHDIALADKSSKELAALFPK